MAYLCKTAPAIGQLPVVVVWGAVMLVLIILATTKRDTTNKTAKWPKIEEANLELALPGADACERWAESFV